VNLAVELPGKLFPCSASLFFWATQELLKWQTPSAAASELLALLALGLRARVLRSTLPLRQR
jgi:hypothetical protein